MKKLFLLLVLLSSVSLLLWSMNQESPVQWQSISLDRTELIFRLPEYQIKELLFEEQFFSVIEAENSLMMSQEGYPELPFWSISLAIPRHSSVLVNKVEHSNSLFLEGHRIFPVQNWNDQQSDLVMDQEIYPPIVAQIPQQSQSTTSLVVYPENIYSLTEVQSVRDYQFITINFYPFRFHAQTQNLEINEEISITIHYQGGDSSSIIDNPYSLHPKISRSFEKLYASLFANYDAIRMINPVYQEPSLLIIYGGNAGEQPIFQQFVEWRKQTGYVVNTAGVASIGNSTTMIKNYIQNAYDTWEHPPEYVLFVGNIRSSTSYVVPAYSFNPSYMVVYGDYPYSHLEGNDQLGDVFIGRLPAENLNQLTNLFNKIFRYERQPFIGGESWLSRSLLVGDWGGNSGGSGISTVITNRNIKETIQAYDPQHSFQEVYSNLVTPTQMINTFNLGGVNFHYRGFYLMNGFSSAHINQVNNVDMLANCVWITCGTAHWDENSPSEAAVKRVTATNGHAGAITATGMSASATHTAYNNLLSSALYNGLYHHDMPNMGMANLYAKIYQQQVYNHQATQAYYHAFYLCLFGDPTLNIYKTKPLSFEVLIPESIPFGTQGLSFVVQDQIGNSVSGAWVTIRNSTGTYYTKAYTDAQGNAVLSLEPTGTENLVCTITREGFVPLFQEITVINNPFVAVLDYTLNTQNTNFVDQNETVLLGLEIKNYSIAAQTNLQAVLSSDSELVNIPLPNIELGSFNPNEVRLFPSSFSFQVLPTAQDQELLPLTISISNGVDIWNSYLLLTIKGVSLAVIQTSVLGEFDYLTIDSPNEIYFEISNQGSIAVENLQAVFSSDSIFMEVTQAELYFGTINPDQSVMPLEQKIGLSLYPEVIPGMEVWGKLHFYADQEFQQTIPIHLIAGSKSIDDPTGPDEYGYMFLDWNDSSLYDAPTYVWQEISDSGTDTNLFDVSAIQEEDAKTIDLPFIANFYGESYSQITICSNGWFSFGQTNVKEFRNLPLPSPAAPKAMVAVYWTDLVVGGTFGGGVYTYYNENLHAFIIQWNEVKVVIGYPTYATLLVGPAVTFQAIIYDPLYYSLALGDSPIRLQYKTFYSGDSGSSTGPINYFTVGIQDHQTENGLTYVFNNDYQPGASTLGYEKVIDISQPSFLGGNLVLRGTIEGVITSNSQPVQNVLVRVRERNRYTSTDADGFFSIPFLPVDVYSLELLKYMYHPQILSDIEVFVDEITHRSAEILPINNNLTAQNLSGPVLISEKAPFTFSMSISNEGHLAVTSSSYTLQLRELGTDIVLASTPGKMISSLATENFELIWTPMEMGNKSIYGYINFGFDEILDNNSTSYLEVEVLPFGTVVKYAGNENSPLASYQLPLNYYYRNSITQTIYPASTLNQYGMITKLVYFFHGWGDISPNSPPIRIYMGKTNQNLFLSGVSSWIPFADFTLVFEGQIPVYSSGSYPINIDLQTPFIYDRDNLVIMVHRLYDNVSTTIWSINNTFQYTQESSGQNRSIQAAIDNANAYDPTIAYPNGTAQNRTPNTMIYLMAYGSGNLSGIVQSSNATPLAGAEVAIPSLNRKTTTNQDGYYFFDSLFAGNLEINVKALGYYQYLCNVDIEANTEVIHDPVLIPLPQVTINGQVLASDTGTGLSGAIVSLTGYNSYQEISGTNGQFSLIDIWGDHIYSLTISHSGYETYQNPLLEVETSSLQLDDITLLEQSLPPRNVVAQQYADSLFLSWDPPSEQQESWFGYGGPDVAEITQQLNPSQGLELRQKYSAEELIIFGATGRYISHLAYYLNDEKNFAHTLKIYTASEQCFELSNNLIYEQQLLRDQLQPFCWNTIALNQLIYIPPETDIWLGMEIKGRNDYSLAFATPNGFSSPKQHNYIFVNKRLLSVAELWGAEAGDWLFQVMLDSVAPPNRERNNRHNTKSLGTIDLTQPFNCSNQLHHSLHASQELHPTSRSLISYSIYRLVPEIITTPNLWTLLAENIQETTFTDQEWKALPASFYCYAVLAVFTGNNYSPPAFSHSIERYPASRVDISIIPQTTIPLTETIVVLRNQEELDDVYSQTLISNQFSFDLVRKGNYTLTINRFDYALYQDHQIVISADQTSITAHLVYARIVLSEGFESLDFPPEGWLLYDHDQDGQQWYRSEIKANTGRSAATSASWLPSGPLTPDNYLVSPVIDLHGFSRATLRFFVSTQHYLYPQEIYSVLVSTATTAFSDFVTVYTDTLTTVNLQWQEREIDLSSFTSDNIYLAFRHHDSTNMYQVYIDDVEVITGFHKNEDPEPKPRTYLHGNYPNPFNPHTFIVFELAKKSNVKIEIFNLKGQLIRILLNEVREPDRYLIPWLGTDNDGHRVSSGLYFYRMTTPQYSRTQKMILLK